MAESKSAGQINRELARAKKQAARRSRVQRMIVDLMRQGWPHHKALAAAMQHERMLDNERSAKLP